MVKFKTKLSKLGNSEGIFLPKPLRDTLDLKVGDDVVLEDREDSIVIKKA